MKPLSDRALERLRRAAAAPDLTGTRYQLKRELGRGGMGAVYLAADTLLHRDVALKVLHLDEHSPEFAARLRREAQTLAQLEHPNIVPVYDIGELPGNRLFYAMKFVEGQRLDAWAESQQALPDRLRLFVKICEAVAYAHSHDIIHRDLKPGNIMVGPFGEVLIMDWGLAILKSESETPGRVLGTPHYMAPEQARGETRIDERADIYALGALLSDLTGPETPRPLKSIVAKATSAEPMDRYDAALSLGREVLRFLDGQRVQAHRESAWESIVRFATVNRTLLLIVVSYIVMRVLVLLVRQR